MERKGSFIVEDVPPVTKDEILKVNHELENLKAELCFAVEL